MLVQMALEPGTLLWSCTAAVDRGLAPLTTIPALSPIHTLISLHLETTGEKFSVTQFWTAGGVMMILP